MMPHALFKNFECKMSILNQIDFDVPSSRNTSEFLDDESESLKDDLKTLHVQVRLSRNRRFLRRLYLLFFFKY